MKKGDKVIWSGDKREYTIIEIYSTTDPYTKGKSSMVHIQSGQEINFVHPKSLKKHKNK
jgi:hypothetical protein